MIFVTTKGVYLVKASGQDGQTHVCSRSYQQLSVLLGMMTTSTRPSILRHNGGVSVLVPSHALWRVMEQLISAAPVDLLATALDETKDTEHLMRLESILDFV